MEKRNKIAYININLFDPKLRDGASNATLELMQFLRDQGNDIYLFNYLTNDKYGRYKLASTTDIKNITETPKINFYQKILPLTIEEVFQHPGKFIKTGIEDIKQLNINYAFTSDSCFAALLVVSLLKIPGAHSFHSLSNIIAVANNTFFITILKKRNVFANSKFIQIKIKELLGIDSTVLYPTVNLNKYKTTQNCKKESIGFTSYYETKGIEIIKNIIKKMPQNNFIGVGEKGYNKCEFRNLKNMGHIKNMKKFYEKIKILLVPSLLEEAFGRVIIEAASCGIPVIANNVGGIPEILCNTGILINVDLERIDNNKIANKYVNWINRLLQDEKLYASYRKKALLFAKQFEVEQNRLLSTKLLDNETS